MKKKNKLIIGIISLILTIGIEVYLLLFMEQYFINTEVEAILWAVNMLATYYIYKLYIIIFGVIIFIEFVITIIFACEREV